MQRIRLGGPRQPLSIAITYNINHAEVLGWLKDATSPNEEFPTKTQYTAFRDALATIFSNSTFELPTEVSNTFGFEGISNYEFASLGASEQHVASTQQQELSPAMMHVQISPLQDSSIEEMLKTYLKAYADEVDSAIKGCCAISDSDPLLISQSLSVLFGVWHDFRFKLANVSTLLAENSIPIKIAKKCFVQALERDLVPRERAERILGLICNGIMMRLIGSRQPSILTLRTMISFVGAVNSQYMDILVEKLIPSIAALLKGKLNGFLTTRNMSSTTIRDFLYKVQRDLKKMARQGFSYASNLMRFNDDAMGTEDGTSDSDNDSDDDIASAQCDDIIDGGEDGDKMSFGNILDADSGTTVVAATSTEIDPDGAFRTGPISSTAQSVDDTEITIPISALCTDETNPADAARVKRHYTAPKLSGDVSVAILNVISLLNAYTEVLAYLLQTMHLDLPTRVAEAMRPESHMNGVFMLSLECQTLIKLQINLANLRKHLLIAMFEEIEPLLKASNLSYTVVCEYFTGGKGFLCHLYALAHEAEGRCGAQGSAYLTNVDNFILKSLDLTIKYVYKHPGTYALCISKILTNPYIVDQNTPETDKLSLPIAQTLALNLLYIASVVSDIESALGPIVSNSLLVSLRKIQSNLANSKGYELENTTLKAYVHSAAYMDNVYYNKGNTIVSIATEAVLILIDSVIRLVCLLELKLGELDELFGGSSPSPYIQEYLSTLSGYRSKGKTFYSILCQVFTPSISFTLTQVLICAFYSYSTSIAAAPLTIDLTDPLTTAIAEPIGASTGVPMPRGTKIPWEKVLMHAAPPKKQKPSFTALFDIVEALGRVSWQLVSSCINFLRQKDNNLRFIVIRMVSLSLHRFLCFPTSYPLLILEQESYMEFGMKTSAESITDLYQSYLSNITSASNIVHAARNITMSTNNYVLISTTFKNVLDEAFVYIADDQKQSWLNEDMRRMLMAFVSDHIKVVSSILESALEVSDVPSLHILSLSGSIIVCTKEVADVLESVLQKRRVFPDDLAGVAGKNFEAVYKQMVEDGLLVMDQKGYLAIHPDILEDKSGKKQLKDLTEKEPVMAYFNRKRCDYACLSYVNEGAHYKHLNYYNLYHIIDEDKFIVPEPPEQPRVKEVGSVLDLSAVAAATATTTAVAESEVTALAKTATAPPQAAAVTATSNSLTGSQQGGAGGAVKDSNTITALANAYMVRLVKVCGPLSRAEIIERCTQEVSGVSNDAAKTSLDNLIDMDYLSHVEGSPTMVEYVP